MEIIGFELGELLTRQVIYLVVIFFLGVILLHVETSIIDFKKRSFGKAAGVLIAGSVVAFIIALDILILFGISIIFIPAL